VPVNWILVGCALLSFSPWPGAAAILRRAEKNPGVLITDPDRRRERGRHGMRLIVLMNAAIGAVVGYILAGWEAAATLCGLVTLIGIGASWFTLRHLR
jgi:hypothetical protein